MENRLSLLLKETFGASVAEKTEIVQELWSGYGEISRWKLNGSVPETVITKEIILPEKQNHPRGWNSNESHQRKIRSYQVEAEWYKNWTSACTNSCRIPHCYIQKSQREEQLLVLEDLDAAGFTIRKSKLNIQEAKLGLSWLANFHATFLNQKPIGLWRKGTYWHLETRADEWEVMEKGELKDKAYQLDEILAACKFQTLVHGDAKVANFSFSTDMKQIAAVDFQYVGGGCGMKDVIYFLGSCLSSDECELFEEVLLSYYFKELKKAVELSCKSILFNDLEKEWRSMYQIAWADFNRFLMGWMPNHQKINPYSSKMVEQALIQLEDRIR